jgi:hypothetical protein
MQIEIAIKNALHSRHSSILLFHLISSTEFLVDFYMG